MYPLGYYWLFPPVRKRQSIQPSVPLYSLRRICVGAPAIYRYALAKKSITLVCFYPTGAATVLPPHFSSGSMRSRTLSRQIIIVKSKLQEKTKSHCSLMRLGGGLHLSRSPFPACARGCCFPKRAMQNQLSWVGRGWFMARRVALSRERERKMYLWPARRHFCCRLLQSRKCDCCWLWVAWPHLTLWDLFVVQLVYQQCVYLFTKLNMLIFSW